MKGGMKDHVHGRVIGGQVTPRSFSDRGEPQCEVGEEAPRSQCGDQSAGSWVMSVVVGQNTLRSLSSRGETPCEEDEGVPCGG